VRHEARERCEAADAEHDEVAFFARADLQAPQRARAPPLLGKAPAFHLQRAQLVAAVRRHQTRHERGEYRFGRALT
jgi:hypothetical protein